MKVSVVICSYDPEMFEHLAEALDSVRSQTYDQVELVLVIDGNEELADRVEREYGRQEDVQVHCNEVNRGLLESRNIGVELANGDLVAFIDDDAVADDQWIQQLVTAYREEDAIAVGGKMTPIWVDDQPIYLPEEFYWLIGVTHKGFSEGAGEVRNTFGSNLSFRREVFLELEGFDTEVGGRKGEKNLQGGETELCARMRAEYGQGVWYNPEAVVGHKVFSYRTQFYWLVDRAFWQGYSKRKMAEILPESSREEGEYLSKLLTDFLPHRVKRLTTRPSVNSLSQLAMMAILSGAVGSGYLFGAVR